MEFGNGLINQEFQVKSFSPIQKEIQVKWSFFNDHSTEGLECYRRRLFLLREYSWVFKVILNGFLDVLEQKPTICTKSKKKKQARIL